MFAGVTPGIAKLIDYLLQRIDASRRNESLRQRPGSKVAQQMIEILRCCHFEHYINVIATESMACPAEAFYASERAHGAVATAAQLLVAFALKP